MANLDFWLAAGGLTLGVSALLVLSARAGSRIGVQPTTAAGTVRGNPDLQVYRDQLRDVERDLGRGILPAAEAERLRTEIARRLLEADRKAGERAGPAARRGGLWLAAGAIVLAAAGAVYTYDRVGLPGYPDMPLSARLAEADQLMALRPAQADYIRGLPAEPAASPDGDYLALLNQLRKAVDPATATDARGLELLARNEGALGNFTAALAAQDRLITVRGDAATADDHAMRAEFLIRQAQGYVSPEAEADLTAALRRDPEHGLARYYTGLMFAQGGRFDRAFALWRPLLENGPADAPWRQPLLAQIGEVAALAGVDYTLPEPSPADLPTAADIEGMVAQLSGRLASEGGSAEEWARLIRSLGVLGRQDEARSITAEARQVFAGKPGDLALIEAEAKAAGADQ